jgi:hypothetical protein
MPFRANKFPLLLKKIQGMKRSIILLAGTLLVVAMLFSSCKSGDHCPAYGSLPHSVQVG